MKMKIAHIGLLALWWCFSFSVSGQCVSSFISDSTVCFGDTLVVTFNGNGSRLQWNVQDPGAPPMTDTSSTISHVFSRPGLFAIQLIVSDSTCSDTSQQMVRVVSPVQSAFRVSNNCVSAIATFTPQLITDSVDSPKSYSWWLQGVFMDTSRQWLHTFNDTGQYHLELRVMTALGCRDTVMQTLMVYPPLQAAADAELQCRSRDIAFDYTDNGFSVIRYQWNFGDGFTSVQKDPIYQYQVSDTYFYSLQVMFSDSSVCQTDQKRLVISKDPDSDFRLISDSVQCFTGNQFCIQLLSSDTDMLYRSILWGDGFLSDTFPSSDSILCHQYSDTGGGVFRIVVDVVDRLGCSSRTIHDSIVWIHRLFDVSFSAPQTVGCFSTTSSFTNRSNHALSEIQRFRWDFGDGQTDTLGWSPRHTYVDDGIFDVTLWAINKLGCEDSMVLAGNIRNIQFELDATLDTVVSNCLNNNRFIFSQTPYLGGQVMWRWGDGQFSESWQAGVQYENIGDYIPTISVSAGQCVKTKTFDTIKVIGPLSLFGQIQNQFQCQITDTVYFRSASAYSGNASRYTIWDFGDPYAPACTTNSQLGIHLGRNCRYSTDSIFTQHWYTPGTESCFRVTLWEMDTVNGCISRETASLPLTRPKASRDLITTPPLQGLGVNGARCFGSNHEGVPYQLMVNLSQTRPGCGQEIYWVMWDSLAAELSGNFDAHWRLRSETHRFDFNNRPADPNGFVTVGLIIHNGRDSLNRICADTAWYHHMLEYEHYDPSFVSDYQPQQHYCKNSTFTFRLRDTLQREISRLIWIWDDGTQTVVDSHFTQPVSKTFLSAGLYSVQLVMFTKKGCSAMRSQTVKVGFQLSYDTLLNEPYRTFCHRDRVPFLLNLNYYSSAFPSQGLFWNDTSRATAGKETLEVDFDDGKGFRLFQPPYEHFFNRGGVFNITLHAKDSMGCRDTLALMPYVSRYIKTDFTTERDTFYCSQNVRFTSMVSQFDSLGQASQFTTDEVIYRWVFSSGLAPNVIPRPVVFLREGIYDVFLKAETGFGCADSVSKRVVVKGPTADFAMVGDSVGCQPLQVTFQNKSVEANRYLWRFNDGNGAVFNTTSDSQFNFMFRQHGVFYPQVTVFQNYTVNGIPLTCSSTFPDTIQPSLREVTVWESPRPGFGHITNCANRTVQFYDMSTITTASMEAVLWDFGDGQLSGSPNPTHQYADTGRYLVRLYSYADNGCMDSIRRVIVISPEPEPDFQFQSQCAGVPVTFEEKTASFNDIIVAWQWDFGDSTYSNTKNPVKTFDSGGTYRVSLTVFNQAGCSRTVVKNVDIYYKPTVSFSVPKMCSRQSSQVTNTSFTQKDSSAFEWWWPDQRSSTLTAPWLSFADEGVYPVMLKVTSLKGCTDSATRQAVVHPTPIPQFQVPDSIQCLRGNAFAFQNLSRISSGSMQSSWDFGDNAFSSTDHPTHTFAAFGTYDVVLTMVSAEQCSDTIRQSVVVKPHPVARIQTFEDRQCVRYNTFVFRDSSTIAQGYTASRFWTIPSLKEDTQHVFSYRFADTGFYTVQMVSGSDFGCYDTAFQRVEVAPMPQAHIVVNTAQQCLNQQSFQFSHASYFPAYALASLRWNLGNGQTSTAQSVQTTYSDTGLFEVTLSVTSTIGCSDTTTTMIEVYPVPQVRFQVNTEKQCQFDNDFIFSNLTEVGKGSLSYVWDFGDGNRSNDIHPRHRYVIADTLSVRLTATSSLGCVNAIIQNMVLHPKPEALFTVNQQNQCINPNLFECRSISDARGGEIARYHWSIPDAGVDRIQTADTFSHSFGLHGSYRAYLFIETVLGCRDTFSLPLEVYPKPMALFDVDKDVECVNLPIFELTNRSDIPYGTLIYEWNVGDGTRYFQPHVTHTYAYADTFQITLTAISDRQCRDTSAYSVIVYPKPDVAFLVNDTGQCLSGHLFELFNQSTISYGTMTYVWELGADVLSRQTDTVVAFEREGTYRIQLTATSEYQCSDSLSQTVTVYPMPEPGFVTDTLRQCLQNNRFIFNNTTTIPYGTLRHRWRTDGAIFDGETLDYSYSDLGEYQVTLYAYSGWQCEDSISGSIRIWANPEADFEVNNESQCVNQQSFQFFNRSQIREGQLAFSTWSMGDGSDQTGRDAQHQYPIRGEYTIRLVMVSDSGCVDSVFRTIKVYPAPRAIIGLNDTAQCLYDHLFEMEDRSLDTLGIVVRRWEMTGMSYDLRPDLSHRFKDTGHYRIFLQVESVLGCVDTVSRMVYVKPMPDPTFEKLLPYYCNHPTFYDFVPVTPGGVFYGENIFQNQFFPIRLWQDTIEYKVTVNGCLDSSKQFTMVYPTPDIDLGADTTLCKYEMLTLDATFWNSTYEWSNKEFTPVIQVHKPGTYRVVVSNLCGKDTSAIQIQYKDHNCRLFLPTAFSPNKDGINEYYRPVVSDISGYTLKIFNRWGELLYEGNQDDKGWDGTFRGQVCMPGVYLAQVHYHYPLRTSVKHLYENTTLMLIR